MKKKYALICHDVSPVLGSEAGNAWSIILELENKKVECDIYCAATNQLGTENYKIQILSKIERFSYVNFNFVEQDVVTIIVNTIVKKLTKNTTFGTRFTYSLNYRRWLSRVECIINKNQYEWIHLFNHISFRWPLTKMNSHSNYIWGPVSGTDTINLDYFTESKYQKFKYAIRNLFINLTKKSRAIRKFSRRCNKIYCVTKSDMEFFSKFSSVTEQQLDVFSVNVINPTEKSREIIRNKLHLILVGRIDELKGVDIAIDALKHNNDVDLTIYGDGTLFEYYCEYLHKNKIDNVYMRGSLPRSVLMEEYSKYDILLLPTLKEAGCLTVIEAMSKGLPVITHEAFGMTLSVDSDSGWLIPYKDKSSSIKKIKEVVSEILENPEILQSKSILAQHNSRKFEANAFVNKLYKLLSLGSQKSSQ